MVDLSMVLCCHVGSDTQDETVAIRWSLFLICHIVRVVAVDFWGWTSAALGTVTLLHDFALSPLLHSVFSGVKEHRRMTFNGMGVLGKFNSSITLAWFCL